MEYCFGNSTFVLTHNPCYMRKRGAIDISYPNVIELGDGTLRIEMVTTVTAKDFSAYWGSLHNEFHSEKRKGIIIDLTETTYMNLFCISKIILSIFSSQKPTEIIWPESTKEKPAAKNKMLRFFYNLGILDVLFSGMVCYGASETSDGKEIHPKVSYRNNITNNIGGEVKSRYHESYDFTQIFDKAVQKFQVFALPIRGNVNNFKVLEHVYNATIKKSLEDYYSDMGLLTSISERLFMYFTEIADNIIEHAYPRQKNILFTLVITNDYLPEYAITGKDRDKFDKRIRTLENQIPKYAYGDFEERHFGGLSLFIDDCGTGIVSEEVKPSKYGALYNKIYRDGIPEIEREKGKTSINGLKLVFDQICDYNDHLWIHDNRCWIGTFFSDQPKPEEVDYSLSRGNTEITAKDHYIHPYIPGVTYEIRINFSRHSPNRELMFNRYGVRVNRSLEQIKDLLKKGESPSLNSEYLVIDKINKKNQTRSWKKEIEENNFNSIVFRPSRKQKNDLQKELITWIVGKIEKIHESATKHIKFDTLFIADLTHTQVFQMRAVVETFDISRVLMDCNVKNVVLISKEFFVFVMEPESINAEKFILLEKSENSCSERYVMQNQVILNEMFTVLHMHDRKMFCEHSRVKKYLVLGNIEWNGSRLSSFLDVERMMTDHGIFEIMARIIIRLDGLLGKSAKVNFFEGFMERGFSSFTEANKNPNATDVYVGSIVFSQSTQRSKVADDSNVLYFFIHNQSASQFRNTVAFLDYPQTRSKRNKRYRKVLYSNRLEEYGAENRTIGYYLGEDIPGLNIGKYQNHIAKISYDVGFFPSGLFKIEEASLVSAFEGFLVDQLVLLGKDNKRMCLTVKSEKELMSIDTNAIISAVREHFPKRTHNQFCLSCNADDFTDQKYKDVYVYHTVTIEDLLDASKNNRPVFIITLYNTLELNTRFSNIIDQKYFPFIPIRVRGNNYVIARRIKGIVRYLKDLLSPEYKDKFKSYSNDFDAMGEFGLLDRIKLDKKIAGDSPSLLYDCIQLDINRSNNIRKKLPFTSELHYLAELLTIAAGCLKPLKGNESHNAYLLKGLTDMISVLMACKTGYDDTVVSFFALILTYALDINRDITLLYNKNRTEFENMVTEAFDESGLALYRILFATFLKEIDEWKHSERVDKVFHHNANQAYQDLFVLLFNEHGADHDSPLAKYVKSTETYNLTDANSIDALVNTALTCISLIKYIRAYDENLDDVLRLESSMKNNFDGLKSLDHTLRELIRCNIEELQKIADRRFYKIPVSERMENQEEKIIGFIHKIYERLGAKVELPLSWDSFKLYVHYVKGSYNIPKDMKNAVLCNDPFILDEIGSLINDAIKKHSSPFSLKGHGDKPNQPYWITCEIIPSYVMISIYNSTEKLPLDVQEEIRNKPREGKKLLSRYNVSVEYVQALDDEYNGTNENIIKTIIKCPFFT